MVLVSNPFGGASRNLGQLKNWITLANTSGATPNNNTPIFGKGKNTNPQYSTNNSIPSLTGQSTGQGTTQPRLGGNPQTGITTGLQGSGAPSTLSSGTYLDSISKTTPSTNTGGIASRMLNILKGQKAGQDAAIEEANRNILMSAKKFKAALGLDSANQENAAANGYGLRGGTFAQQQAAVNSVKNQNFSKALQLEGQTANSIAGLAGQKAQLETQVGGQALNVIAQTELADEQQRKQQAAQEALYRLQASLK